MNLLSFMDSSIKRQKENAFRMAKFIIVCFVVFIPCLNCQDPCTSYQELSRGKYRGGNCPYVANKGVCDTTLTKAWYRVQGLNGSLEIQNTPAKTETCGTLFPYWMQGSHPIVADDIVTRNVCRTDLHSSCSDTKTIRVKNCGVFYVYELSPLSSCPLGYCFGKYEKCPPLDPCDVFEHSTERYDAGRAGSCNSNGKTTCDHFNGTKWVRIAGQTGYLNVTSSCPSKNACGTEFPLWINDTIKTLPNGISTKSVCVREGSSCCASTLQIETKLCNQFTVYNFTNSPVGQCQRYCVDDHPFRCPDKAVTLNPATNKGNFTTVTKDTGTDGAKNYLWIIGAVIGGLVILTVVIAVTIVVVVRVIKPPRTKQTSDSSLFDEKTKAYERTSIEYNGSDDIHIYNKIRP